MEAYVTVARIVKTRGIRGEVSAIPLSDLSERYASLQDVRVLVRDQEFFEVIEDLWFHNDRLIVKFAGRDRPHEVDELVGGEIQIPENERFPLPEDTYYHSDLIGCQVFEGDRRIGEVVEVFETGSAGINLVVQTVGGLQFMIPLARRFVLGIEVETKTIRVRIPEGLMDTAERI